MTYGSGWPATPKTLNYIPETQFQHPEGVKYGLRNYVWEPTKMSYRPDRFGQFRDMLEQRRYSKFFILSNWIVKLYQAS